MWPHKADGGEEKIFEEVMDKNIPSLIFDIGSKKIKEAK